MVVVAAVLVMVIARFVHRLVQHHRIGNLAPSPPAAPSFARLLLRRSPELPPELLRLPNSAFGSGDLVSVTDSRGDLHQGLLINEQVDDQGTVTFDLLEDPV